MPFQRDTRSLLDAWQRAKTGTRVEAEAFEADFRSFLQKGESEHSALANANVRAAELMEALADANTSLQSANAQLTEQRQLEEKLASRLQLAVLPTEFDIEGCDVSAHILRAEAVGGDYYDVIRMPGGAFVAMGDVSGHGFDAGLCMLMVQSGLSSLVRAMPDAPPSVILTALNAALYDNFQVRLKSKDFVTLSLLRLERGGKLVFAGAHEPMLILRHGGGVDTIQTPGPWLGAMRSVAHVIEDTELEIHRGDTLLLYTDGITEARGADGKQFGLEPLCETLVETRGQRAKAIVARAFERLAAWTEHPKDDVAVLALRFGTD